MAVVFHKMHGAGNDFVLLDLRHQNFELDSRSAAFIANRRTGIGCDQILVLREALAPENSARYEIWNSDGSPAGQCGNGARCIGHYLGMNDDIRDRAFTLESPSGVVGMKACSDGEFVVEMGVPDFEPARVPISLSPDRGKYTLDSPWGLLEIGAASMGNPHALLLTNDIGDCVIEGKGAFISSHEAFPEGCNAGIAQIENRGRIRLRVYERGAGETLACGSGACAAVAILRRWNRVDKEVDVLLPGGHLVIMWPGNGQTLKMKGPAEYVFKGTIEWMTTKHH
jgi:diaminopimelate epimerase